MRLRRRVRVCVSLEFVCLGVGVALECVLGRRFVHIGRRFVHIGRRFVHIERMYLMCSTHRACTSCVVNIERMYLMCSTHRAHVPQVAAGGL